MPTFVWLAVAAIVSAPPTSSQALGQPGGSWLARDADAGPPGFGVVGRIGSARLSHGAEVRSLAFSPNSALLVSADCQQTVIVWEATTGRVVRRWDLPARPSGAVGFSADGGRVVWCLGDGYLRSNDVRTGAEVRATRHGSPNVIIAVRPDGPVVAAGRDGRIRLWDETTGRPGEFVEADERVARSDCGRYEASVVSPSNLVCLDHATGTEQHFSPGDDRLHRLGCVCFSADARWVFASGFAGRVLRFDRATGEVLNRYGPFASSPDCLVVSPDGTCLAVAIHNRVHLLDVGSGVDRFPTSSPFARPPAMRISVDGRSLTLSGGHPSPREETWDVGTLCRRSSTPIPRSAWEERMSPFPLVAPDGMVRVSFGGSGRGFSQFDTSVLSFSDGYGKPLWSVKKGLAGRDGYAFSADGAWVAVVEEDGLGVYESKTGRMIRDLPYTGQLARREWAHGVAFSPDRFAVLTAHATGLVYWPVGNTHAPREVRLPAGERLEGRESLLAISPDGRLAVFANDRFELVVLELATLAERFRFSTRRRGPASSTLFAPDGRRLFVANGDGTVTIHDLAAGPGPMNGPVPTSAAAWDDLRSPDAAAAYRTMRRLANKPDQTATWLASQLSATKPDGRVAGWIRQLDAPRYAVREAAQRELARLGHAARAGLLAAARTDLSAECRRRVEALLEETCGPDVSPDGIRIGRAVEVLDQIGTIEAKTLLRDWAGGPEGDTRADRARAAVAHLDPGH